MFFYSILFAFNKFIAVLPCAWLCYLPFKTRLIRPFRKVALEVTLICALQAVISALLFFNLGFDRRGNFTLFACLPVLFFYYRKNIQEDLQKLLFVFFMVLHAAIVISSGVSITIYALINYITEDITWADLLVENLTVTATIICYLFTGRLINRVIAPRLNMVEPRNMRHLWLAPVTISFLPFFYYMSDYSLGINYLFIIVFLPLTVFSFAIYKIILDMLDNTVKNLRLEAESARAKEESLALERADRMKSDLIATVTHETMTPLAVLSVYAELVADELRSKGVDEQTAKDLDTISEETQRVKWLLDELRNHNRKKSGGLQKTRFNLMELIESTARLYKPILERKNISLSLVFPESLPDVYARANEVTQVFFNLLQNARNHGENGSVRVEVNALSGESERDFIEVAVSDSGSGIAPELLPHIFERGVTGGGSERGLGLGLAICKEIVEEHGGRIAIRNENDSGTRVTFTLPVWNEGLDNNEKG